MLCFLLTLSCATNTWAGVASDPLKSSLAAKTLGMGGGLAMGGDSLPFENPTQFISSQGRLTLQSTTLLGDIQQNLFTYSFPNASQQDQWGLSLLYVGVSNLLGTSLDDNGQVNFSATNPFSYDQRVFVLSHARQLTEFVRLGANLKYFTQQLEGSGNGSGFGLDVGATLSDDQGNQLSLMHRNAFLAKSIVWTTGSTDTLESYSQFALTQSLILFEHPLGLLLGLDWESHGLPLHVGLSWKPRDILTLRGGIDQSVGASGGGTVLETYLTMGLGLAVENFTFDYAYHPYAFSALDSHVFSVSYAFN